MTTLDKQALEKAWDAYMAAVLAEHPHARFQTQTPEQREENQRFVNTAITAYLDALPEARRAWGLRSAVGGPMLVLIRVTDDAPAEEVRKTLIPIEIREVRDATV